MSRFLRSRSPVREAIRILTAEGLIEPAGNRGVQVRRAEAEEIIQTLSVIGTLEAMAGELAAAISEPEMRRIDEAHHLMVAAFQANDQATYYHSNQAIHRAIWEAADNAVLLQELERLNAWFGHTASRSITGWKAGENLSRTITASWSRCLIVTAGGSVRSSVAPSLQGRGASRASVTDRRQGSLSGTLSERA